MGAGEDSQGPKGQIPSVWLPGESNAALTWPEAGRGELSGMVREWRPSLEPWGHSPVLASLRSLMDLKPAADLSACPSPHHQQPLIYLSFTLNSPQVGSSHRCQMLLHSADCPCSWASDPI